MTKSTIHGVKFPLPQMGSVRTGQAVEGKPCCKGRAHAVYNKYESPVACSFFTCSHRVGREYRQFNRDSRVYTSLRQK